MTALGTGGSGPWEDRTQLVLKAHTNPCCVAGHLNQDHSVQRFQYDDYPGIDVLTVRRHDGEAIHPGWAALQKIKDRLAPDGTERWGFELFPPTIEVVDNHNLWHVWVMPRDWRPPIAMGVMHPGVRI